MQYRRPSDCDFADNNLFIGAAVDFTLGKSVRLVHDTVKRYTLLDEDARTVLQLPKL
jgi:hypothetical protein